MKKIAVVVVVMFLFLLTGCSESAAPNKGNEQEFKQETVVGETLGNETSIEEDGTYKIRD